MEHDKDVKRKWQFIVDKMRRIESDYNGAMQRKIAYDTLRRLSAHNTDEQKMDASSMFTNYLVDMMKELNTEFILVKKQYQENRDEFKQMAKKDEIDFVNALERCISDDVDRILFNDEAATTDASGEK